MQLQHLLNLLLNCSLLFASAKDLYARLGLKKGASEKEIKKAYRQKAKDTHPDRNPNVDPEIAAQEFREIAEAYEILSDDRLRSDYDRTGQTAAEREAARREHASRYNQQQYQQRQQQSNRQRSSSGGWHFQFNFGGGNRNTNTRADPKIRYHPYYTNYATRRHILQCQNRVLSVTGLPHLERIALDDDTGLTDRYVLLAVYDSRVPQCENLLNYYVLFPWPFAGFTRENDNSMWWEEIMLVTKIDLAQGTQISKDLADLLGIDFEGDNKVRCPAVALFPRHSRLTAFDIWSLSEQDDPTKTEFREWVWHKLRMQITFKNKTPWTLHQWWLDGTRGKQLENIEPEGEYGCNTFISHSFLFRASFVEGRMLNNEVTYITGLFFD